MTDKLRTPDLPAEPVSYQHIVITLPNIPDIVAAFWGAVVGISLNSAWKLYGTMETRDAANYIKQAVLSRKVFNMLGTIQAVVRETLDDTMLICDGSVHQKTDYPELWDIWPNAMKDGTTLTLPDLSEKFLRMASGTNPLGSEGGEAEVTLTEAQMPAHNHGYFTPTFNVDVEAPGVPDPTGVGNPQVPASTDFAGGGESHNNIPPFYSVIFAVVAKVKP